MSRSSNALATLLNQINVFAPRRNKASDGGLGDAAHAARKSDHNPDGFGIYHARDFTHDPVGGLNADTLRDSLVTSGDKRIKYIIRNRRIWYPSSGWKEYTGLNAHTLHLHLSVYGDDGAHWNLSLFGAVIGGGLSPIGEPEPCRTLQRVLNAWYPLLPRLAEDGQWGPLTEARVRWMQSRAHLTVDGIPGPITLRALGIG